MPVWWRSSSHQLVNYRASAHYNPFFTVQAMFIFSGSSPCRLLIPSGRSPVASPVRHHHTETLPAPTWLDCAANEPALPANGFFFPLTPPPLAPWLAPNHPRLASTLDVHQATFARISCTHAPSRSSTGLQTPLGVTALPGFAPARYCDHPGHQVARCYQRWRAGCLVHRRRSDPVAAVSPGTRRNEIVLKTCETGCNCIVHLAPLVRHGISLHRLRIGYQGACGWGMTNGATAWIKAITKKQCAVGRQGLSGRALKASCSTRWTLRLTVAVGQHKN